MKRILATILLALISVQANAKCADRYYYYEAKLTVQKIKNWNVYQDLTVPNSREIKDIINLNLTCTIDKGLRHNSAIIFNYIVDGDAWKKIPKPLYPNLTINFPNGLFGTGKMSISINEQHQKYRQYHFQQNFEYKNGPNITDVKIYIVRRGIDEIYTPKMLVLSNKHLQRDGYFYTEFKN